MSRFGRDYIVVGDYLEQIFPFLDVRFIAINDSYDSKDHKYGSAGLIDVSFRNVIYDLYSKDLSEKVRSTKKQLAEKGYCVAPYAFFGYQKAPGNKHTLLVDEDAAAHHGQGQADDDGGQGFVLAVSVVVGIVLRLGRNAGESEHDYVGGHVREGVDGVGDHRAAASEQAGGQLADG